MESSVFFSTCSALATGIESRAPAGISLRRLRYFDSDTGSLDFSEIHFVANIDSRKISIIEAIDYLLSECSVINNRHYFEIHGMRFSIRDKNAIFRTAKKMHGFG